VTKGFWTQRWHLTLLSILFLGFFLFPVYWLVTTALRPSSEIFAITPKLIPDSIDWKIWTTVLHTPGIPRYFLNSLIVACGTTVLTIALATPCAYGLAHLPLKGKSLLLLLSLSSLMFPTVMLAIPLYVIFYRLGLVNTYAGLILANTTVALPFAITILRPFFLSIPKEISEAARIDGCNPFQAFLWTMLPVSTPGIFTIGIFTFLSSWGDLLFGLTIITDDTMRPVTAGLWKFIGSNVSQWNMVMALAAMEMLPPFLLFLLTQRYVVAGLTAGTGK
jgi:multiple sugar transport system permease protein